MQCLWHVIPRVREKEVCVSQIACFDIRFETVIGSLDSGTLDDSYFGCTVLTAQGVLTPLNEAGKRGSVKEQRV